MAITKATASSIAPAAKGDLVVGSGTNDAAVLAVGTNGYTLVADSSTSTGLAWQAASSGALTLISPTSTANTGGSVTVTGGKVAISGCTSISLNGVFTSTYDNYFIVCNNFTTAAASGIGFRLRTSGTDANGTNYNWAYDSINGTDDGATSSNAWHAFGYGDGSTNINGCTYTIHQPAVAAYTTGDGQWASTDVAGGWAGGFRHAVSTSYDGFTLFTSTHAMTGTIRVYGLAN